MISDFVDRLERRLREPLPGEKAQRLMAPRPVDERRFDFKQRPDARLGSVMVLFYPDQDRLHLPFILRPTYAGAHSGQVSLPGGKYEPGDRDLLDTAIRETQEEIGVDGERIRLIGALSEMYIVVSNFKVLPVVGYIDHKPTFVPEVKEVARIIESPLEHLLDQHRRKEKDIIVGDHYKIRSPYFDIGGEVIWGATAMMLSELVTIIEEIEDGYGPTFDHQ